MLPQTELVDREDICNKDSKMGFKAIVFDKLPVHDTTWSVITGIDGLIYIGICGEMTGGLSAYLASYDPAGDRLDYLLEVADVLGIPADNGTPSHGKVHYCLLPSEDGMLYAATHCTCPPVGDFVWRPWHTWSDSIKQFSGSKIFGYDPKDGKILFVDNLIPRQSTRCMALNQKKQLIYGITYPHDHFFVYDIDRRAVKDYGRIGSFNPQCIFLDRAGNGYTTNDYGFLVRFNAGAEKLEELEVQIPHSSFKNGFHAVPYDVVSSPDGRAVYGVTWDFDVRLFRYFPEEGSQGRMEDLGKPYGTETGTWWDIKDDHTGGLVFGLDGYLYMAMNFGGSDHKSHLIRVDPDNLSREDLGPIHDGDIYPDHICRAARDYEGNLYFADVGMRPTKMFKYTPAGGSRNGVSQQGIIRSWG
ncbi:MAG: hypothetical protein PHT33_07860 [bacterium]|nr:hypothetical protein [bacterium]